MGRKLGVKSPGKYKRKYQDLTDDRIDAAIDFETRGIVWDKQVPGLRLYIGKRKVSWQFYADTRDHGSKGHKFKTLGHYDRGGFASVVGGGIAPPAIVRNYTGPRPLLQRAEWHMSVDAARDQARINIGKKLEGTMPANARAGIKFEDAFTDYCDYLERRAAAKGKPPRWARNVRQLGRQLILPKWSGWTLSGMSESPDKVADWIETIKSPTSANHCRRIVSALYRRRAKRDLSLNKANVPTAAAELRAAKRVQKGMAAKDFPAWYAAWKKIESKTHRSYHMVCLLTGARPGELARCRWQDIDQEVGTLTIGDAKAGNDIPVPLTAAINDALKLAADVAPDHKPGDSIFPGCAQAGHREELPARGHALRRTFKTIATTFCKVPDDVSAFLLGHVPEGMSQKYLLRWALSSGPAIREAQAKISREMVRLLHKRAPAGRKAA
jgi:integrase